MISEVKVLRFPVRTCTAPIMERLTLKILSDPVTAKSVQHFSQLFVEEKQVVEPFLCH